MSLQMAITLKEQRMVITSPWYLFVCRSAFNIDMDYSNGNLYEKNNCRLRSLHCRRENKMGGSVQEFPFIDPPLNAGPIHKC